MSQAPSTPFPVKKAIKRKAQHAYLDNPKPRAKGSPLSGSGAGSVCVGGWESNMFKRAMDAQGAVDYVLQAVTKAGAPACLLLCSCTTLTQP